MKQSFFKKQAEVIKPIVEFYRQDKIKLIKFLIKEGYQQKEIAKVIGVDPSAISHLLKTFKGDKNENGKIHNKNTP